MLATEISGCGLVFGMQQAAFLQVIVIFGIASHKIVAENYIKFKKNDLQSFWSQWSKWSPCTTTTVCYGGSKTRHRKCVRTSAKSQGCSGEYAELKECPEIDCKKIKPMIYTDVAEASMSSFISQECNTDAKYSVASKHGKIIPQPILQRFKHKIMNFLNGFFNIQKFIEKPEVGLSSMTKVCFEPRDLKVKDLPSIYRFNRLVKASLLSGGNLSPNPNDVIYGLTVVIEEDSGVFHGIYYAIKGTHFGYKTVGYRRWRGQGVLDAL